ncbi:MAG: hypothetical protein ACREH5_05280 [Candidatus Omnitrophota bacterium]
MSKLPDEFVRKIAHSLQEEEMDIFVLTLYYRNSSDLLFFSPEDRERVRRIFDILIKDTEHHAELLKLIVEMGSK